MGCLYLTACGSPNDIKAPNAANGNPMVGFYSVFLDSENRMHFYGSVDHEQKDGNLYYNSLFGGQWQYPQNVPVIAFQNDITSTAMGSVLYDASAPFNGYEYVMYFINQPSSPRASYWALYGGSAPCIVEEPDDVGWGLLYVSYSHTPDKGWTTPCQFSIDGVHPVKVEQASAVRINDSIYITALEGDTAIMSANLNAYTYGYMIESTIGTPARGARVSSGYYSLSGINGFNPHITLTGANTTDDNPVMFNLDTSYDPITHDFYLTRAYAYPFDVTAPTTGEVPCNSTIPKGMATYPMRSQLYKMNLPGADVNTLYTGVWTLLEDYGNAVGYGTSTNGGACIPAPLQAGQTNLSGKIGTMSILRNPDGTIHNTHQLILSYGTGRPYIIRGNW